MRIKAGPHRDKLEHVLVTEETLGGPIPVGFDGVSEFRWEVHHMDRVRRHNCRSNLLLIDARLHRYPWGRKEKRTMDVAKFMAMTAGAKA